MKTVKPSQKTNPAAAAIMETVARMVRTKTVTQTVAAIAKRYNRAISKTDFALKIFWREDGCDYSQWHIYFTSERDRSHCYAALNQKILAGKLNIQVVRHG